MSRNGKYIMKKQEALVKKAYNKIFGRNHGKVINIHNLDGIIDVMNNLITFQDVGMVNGNKTITKYHYSINVKNWHNNPHFEVLLYAQHNELFFNNITTNTYISSYINEEQIDYNYSTDMYKALFDTMIFLCNDIIHNIENEW